MPTLHSCTRIKNVLPTQYTQYSPSSTVRSYVIMLLLYCMEDTYISKDKIKCYKVSHIQETFKLFVPSEFRCFSYNFFFCVLLPPRNLYRKINVWRANTGVCFFLFLYIRYTSPLRSEGIQVIYSNFFITFSV